MNNLFILNYKLVKCKISSYSMIEGIIVFLLVLSFNNSTFSQTTKSGYEVRNLLKYVDQNIGIDVGQCSFGISLPFGSIRTCPRTPNLDTSQSNRMYNPKEEISGFTNINMGSVYKYVKLLISPQTGLACFGSEQRMTTDHDSKKVNEICNPDYYSVDLTRYGIKTEITSAHYTSIYTLTYPKTKDGNASIVIYPSSSFWGTANYSTVKYDAKENTISGYLDVNDGWYFARGTIYYAIKFSKPVKGHGTFNNLNKELYDDADTISGEGVGCFLKFNTKEDEKVYLKVAISTKSIENAKKFLNEEITGFDFDKVRSNAAKIWNKSLSTILIDDESVSENERTIFYTALYHSLISPKNRTKDCPWDYSGPYYDDELCVWDTFRSEFPLLTLIKESVVRDNVNSFIEVYKHFGYAPDAFLCGLKDMVQGGDNVDNVVTDAFMKGVKGVNWKDAYKLLKGHATISGRTPYYRNNDRGWVPINTLPIMAYASVSKTLEFAYNDFCASEVAGKLGFNDDKTKFYNRSNNWINLWAPDVSSEGFNGFIMAKDTTGKSVVTDPGNDPAGSFSKYFYEGNSWQYSYYAPHQVSKIIQLNGGKSAFIKRLEYYVANKLTIDNEPAFLVPFLFNYVSRPDLTSRYVRHISNTEYTMSSYPGDDDSGAMSSWYIFSKLGFFPVAGQDIYLINGPSYKKVTLQMENGKKIIIFGNNASHENQYVKSVTLNGKIIDQDWFRHIEIKNGAEFYFDMSPVPTQWGFDAPAPPSY